MRYNLIILFSFFSFSIGYSEESRKIDYSAYYPSIKYIDSLLGGYDQYKKMDFRDKDEYKIFEKSINNVKKEIQSYVKDGLIIHQDFLTNYLQDIANRVVGKNEALIPRKIKIFTLLSSDANAFSLGNGIIFINIGLVTKIKSEAELAFIISHEISHDIENHFALGLHHAYDLSQNTDLNDQLQQIKKKQYGRLKLYEETVSKYLKMYTSKRREFEVQADSVGFLLYNNCGYSKQYAYKAIQRLDSVDLHEPMKLPLSSLLAPHNASFNKNWLLPEEQEETIIGGTYNLTLPDSLKTHPDCKIRYQKISKIPFSQENTIESFSEISFEKIRSQSIYELIDVLRKEENISAGLFYSLLVYSQDTSQKAIQMLISEYFFWIYHYKNIHKITLYSESSISQNDSNYNEILNLIHNISLETSTELARSFFESSLQNPEKKNAYSFYVQCLIESMGLNKNQKVGILNRYKNTYGEDLNYNILLTTFTKNL